MPPLRAEAERPRDELLRPECDERFLVEDELRVRDSPRALLLVLAEALLLELLELFDLVLPLLDLDLPLPDFECEDAERELRDREDDAREEPPRALLLERCAMKISS